MQAFRAATTIDQHGELHVFDVPFRPGTPVEVLVLEQSEESEHRPLGIEKKDPPADQHLEAKRLAEEQYRLASRYPNEYVILVGECIVHHSPDREQAAQAYDRAALASSSMRPVIVRPGSGPRNPPVVRGRALAPMLGGMR